MSQIQMGCPNPVVDFRELYEPGVSPVPSDPCEYSTFLRSRKDVMEVEAIRTVTQLCLQYR